MEVVPLVRHAVLDGAGERWADQRLRDSTRYDEKGWRATFYTTGMEDSPTSATGTAWERTPWRAVQRAARETFKNMETN